MYSCCGCSLLPTLPRPTPHTLTYNCNKSWLVYSITHQAPLILHRAKTPIKQVDEFYINIINPKVISCHCELKNTLSNSRRTYISYKLKHSTTLNQGDLQQPPYYSILCTMKWQDARTRTRGVRTNTSTEVGVIARASHGDIIIKS